MTRHEEIEIPDVQAPLLQTCLLFLDGLRESSETNIFEAAPYLLTQFPQLTKPQARQIAVFWMATFSVLNREQDRRHGYPPNEGSITT